jgi:cyclohexadieny/prephenate dehydrogenase
MEKFGDIVIIGMGLIGSSLARVIRRDGLATRLTAVDMSEDVRRQAIELDLADLAMEDAAEAVKNADLVIIATPIGAYGSIAKTIGPVLPAKAILTDVGSVKQAVFDAVSPHLKPGALFIPGHPIAGTEFSGPAAGKVDLFQGRWAILTPPEGADPAALERLRAFWQQAGSDVAVMDAQHHDRVLAITSHLPHLIAYTIVGTATDLEEHLQEEVIKYSASGFRDFTRIAASDPIMWRDVFLNNQTAVLEMLGRLQEDLAGLQRAIRIGDGATLESHFTRTRAIRRGIIAAKQA